MSVATLPRRPSNPDQLYSVQKKSVCSVATLPRRQSNLTSVPAKAEEMFTMCIRKVLLLCLEGQVTLPAVKCSEYKYLQCLAEEVFYTVHQESVKSVATLPRRPSNSG